MFYSSLLELYQYVNADVAKLADALDLGSSAARRGGSSPSIRTILYLNMSERNMDKVLIIESNRYGDVSNKLLKAATDKLQVIGIEYDHVVVRRASEIAMAASIAMDTLEYQGVIALGCLLRGETDQYEYVCAETIRNINEVGMDYSLPIGLGILTVNDKQQALVRAERYGKEAADACIGLLEIKKRFNTLTQDDNEFTYEN
jgi:6,7-dimethyl-8-ribityllumazine synthase